MNPLELKLAEDLLQAASAAVSRNPKEAKNLIECYGMLKQITSPRVCRSPFSDLIESCIASPDVEPATTPAEAAAPAAPAPAAEKKTRTKATPAAVATPAEPAAATPVEPAAAAPAPVVDLVGDDEPPAPTYAEKLASCKKTFLQKEKNYLDTSLEQANLFRAKAGALMQSLGGTKISDVPQDQIDALLSGIVNLTV